MTTDILELGTLTVTRAAIRCQGCDAPPPNYQITTAGGEYVQLCEACVEQAAVAIRADINTGGVHAG